MKNCLSSCNFFGHFLSILLKQLVPENFYEENSSFLHSYEQLCKKMQLTVPWAVDSWQHYFMMKYQNYTHSILQGTDNLQQLEVLKSTDAFFFCLRRVNAQIYLTQQTLSCPLPK